MSDSIYCAQLLDRNSFSKLCRVLQNHPKSSKDRKGNQQQQQQQQLRFKVFLVCPKFEVVSSIVP
eukprot:3032241-Karenia_brevis.AAC.1